MLVTENQLKFQRKLAVPALLAFSASFFLPFFHIRENRVASEVPVRITECGLVPAVLLLIPPLLILLYACNRSKRQSEIMLMLAGSLGILLPLMILGYAGSAAIQGLGPFSRYSSDSGLYVYILAVMIIYFMKPKLITLDYLAVMLVLSAVLIAGYYGIFNRLGILLEARNFGSRLNREIIAHIRITSISLGISIIIGLPASFISYQSSTLRKLVFPLLNILQTIPAIALFGLLIAPLAMLSMNFPQLRAMGIRGIGNAPAIIALSMYAVYPIVRYSFTAFSSIDSSVILAAQGVGMSSSQVWGIVRFPLAAPSILHGIRVAFVQTIGNATLAKLIGGDGLGVLVFEGLGQASADMVLLGMLLIVALTLVVDRLFQIVIFLLTPVSLRQKDN